MSRRFLAFRLRPRVMALAACGALAACSGADRVVLAPASAPSLAVGPGVECGGEDIIVARLVALFPAGAVANARHQFANVGETYCRKQATARGRALMFDLVDSLVLRFGNHTLKAPPYGGDIPATRAGAVYQLVAHLYAYVGVDGHFAALPADVFARAEWDGAVVVARPGVALHATSTSKNYVTVADTNFFVAPALFVLARQPDATPFQTAFTEYAPRYRTFVVPAEAQANVAHPRRPAKPKAHTSICPADPHPRPVTALRLLRVPLGSGVGELLPRATYTNGLLTCHGGYPDAPPGGYAFAPPTGTAWLAAAGWGVLTRAGASLAELVAPRVAYAVDGGAGGEQIAYSFDGVVVVDAAAAPAAAATRRRASAR